MGAHQVDAVGLQADAAVAGPYLLFFPEKTASVYGKDGVIRQFFKPHGVVVGIIWP